VLREDGAPPSDGDSIAWLPPDGDAPRARTSPANKALGFTAKPASNAAIKMHRFISWHLLELNHFGRLKA
jgi:hypothetical protein